MASEDISYTAESLTGTSLWRSKIHAAQIVEMVLQISGQSQRLGGRSKRGYWRVSITTIDSPEAYISHHPTCAATVSSKHSETLQRGFP